MPNMQYPLTLTWAEIAALPRAAFHFDWDASMADPEMTPDLAAHIKMYMADCHPTQDDTPYCRLPNYLRDVGFIPTDEGVTVKSRLALLIADALFHAVMYEYDETDEAPTWKLFNLSGDDTVDYLGTMPTCLTNLLLDTHIAYTAGLA